MTTRTKLALCAGLLAVAVGVVIWLPKEPQVEVKFLRYAEDGRAVLAFTNRGRSMVAVGVAYDGRRGWALALESESSKWPFQTENYTVGPHERLRLVVASPLQSPTLSVPCWTEPSLSRLRIESLLRKVGINIASTGFVATVNLPPRETNAPAHP